MARWTTAHIPELAGRTAVVTGANNGLGLEATWALASAGAAVILACRNQDKGKAAVEKIRSSLPDAELTLMSLDLASLASIEGFARNLLQTGTPLDILINNAGVMAVPEKELTADGFEMQFGTNHLGHFALTGRLLPLLLEKPSRVVNVTSHAHRTAQLNVDDLSAEGPYKKWIAYGNSKLANLLFTFELDRRARAAETDLVSVAAHPGYSNTNLQDGTAFSITNRIAMSPAQGALSELYAATMPDVEGGDFFGPSGLFEWRGYPKRVESSGAARDTEVAAKLWTASERLTKITYEFTS